MLLIILHAKPIPDYQILESLRCSLPKGILTNTHQRQGREPTGIPSSAVSSLSCLFRFLQCTTAAVPSLQSTVLLLTLFKVNPSTKH